MIEPTITNWFMMLGIGYQWSSTVIQNGDTMNEYNAGTSASYVLYMLYLLGDFPASCEEIMYLYIYIFFTYLQVLTYYIYMYILYIYIHIIYLYTYAMVLMVEVMVISFAMLMSSCKL